MKTRLILGITGGIGSGKSTVLDLLKAQGIPCISSDAIAHRAIRRGTPAYRSILERYGPDILRSTRQICRTKLGRIVFANDAERRWLENRVHPVVIQQLKRFRRDHKGILALDIPLLYEGRLQKLVDKVIVVYSPERTRVQRLIKERDLTAADIRSRIAAQIPLRQKCRRADVVLDNSGTRADLARQVHLFLEGLKKP